MINDDDLLALSPDGDALPEVLGGYPRPEAAFVRASNPLRSDWVLMRPTMLPSICLMGRRHIDRVLESPSCTLVGIADPSPQADALATDLGVPYAATLEALLALGRAEGVILATPNRLHVDQALACLEAGVTTLIEKPVAQSLEDGVRLATAAANSDAKILVGHHRAYSPLMTQAQRLIRQGELGELVAVTGCALFYKPDSYFETAPWRTREGGGPILLNMIHEVHSLRMLCGDIVQIQAFSSHQRRGFAVEDTVAINLRFASGALGTFLLSDSAASAKSWEMTSQEDASYPNYPDEDCYLIAGTNGSLGVPSMRLKRYPSGGERSWWKPFESVRVDTERADPLKLQLEHFCAVVRAEVEPRVGLYDGLQNLRVTDAIQRAATGGGVVDLTVAPVER